mmetsp:Transcript_7052/g.12780  ORF Transcript_7052/g.12780 Transcript_7052/m.12780 type:complete len:224 (+) Transcript_7052:448-1119(+)
MTSPMIFDNTSFRSCSDLSRRSMTTSPSSLFASSDAFIFFCLPARFSIPSGPILMILLVMNGSSGVPEPVVCELSESTPAPMIMSANESPSPFSSSSLLSAPVSLPPPSKSLKLIILPIIPAASPSLSAMDFLGSTFLGLGTPKTALASRFSSDSGTEGDPDGRLDVPPFVSPRIFLRAIPMLLSRPLSFLFAIPSFSSSYKTMPGSALIASCAAVVSGCQLA